MATWIDACSIDDIELEDVIPFQHDGVDYAIYRTADGAFFATAGMCTHEHQLLCDGFVMGNVIECPKHNGRFDLRTGAALTPPAITPLRSYPTRIENGRVLIDVDGSPS